MPTDAPHLIQLTWTLAAWSDYDYWQGQDKRTVLVLGIASHRGPAPIAQSLYAETPESIAERTLQAEQRRLAPEPAHSVKDGRPTKRDRRHLQELRAWDKRWSTQK